MGEGERLVCRLYIPSWKGSGLCRLRFGGLRGDRLYLVGRVVGGLVD